jgi:hypothetical protein
MPNRPAFLSLLGSLALAILAGLIAPAQRPSRAAARVTVAITSPVAGLAVRMPATVTVHAIVTASPEVEVTRVEFFLDGALLGEDISPPYDIDWSPIAPGSYQLLARARYRTHPIQDAVVLAAADHDVLAMPYMDVLEVGGRRYLYYLDNGGKRGELSADGTAVRNPQALSGPVGSVVEHAGTFFISWHHWKDGGCYFDVGSSADGLSFTPDPRNPLFVSGEDMFNLFDGGRFFCFVRPNAKPPDTRRRIGLTRSDDFQHWEPIRTILSPTARDEEEHKELYSMPVARLGSDWYGFLTGLGIGHHGEETEQLDPRGEEQTVEVQLAHSTDGITWRRLNGQRAFIPRGARGQVYVVGSFVTPTQVWLYAIVTDRRHTLKENADVKTTGKYFSTVRYVIDRTDVGSFRDGQEAAISSSGVAVEVRTGSKRVFLPVVGWR